MPLMELKFKENQALSAPRGSVEQRCPMFGRIYLI